MHNTQVESTAQSLKEEKRKGNAQKVQMLKKINTMEVIQAILYPWKSCSLAKGNKMRVKEKE